MRTLLPLALPILLASTPAFAALATDAGTALQFFRSKDSAFPSGQASRTILENKLLRTQTESSYHVRWDHREFDLQGNQILRDIETARFVDTKAVSQLLSLNRADASPVKTVGAGTTLEIVDTDIYWARVKTRDGKVEGWLPISMLKNRHDDTGVFVNIVDTFLRKEASASSSVITTVPRLRRVLPIAFEKGFMKIQYKGFIGYVDVNYFVSRADFASLVYVAGKNWVPTTHRNGENIVTSLREEVPLKNILGYVTSPLRGIVVRPNKSSGPLLLSRVEIIKPEASTWAVSRIDGHGEVWWKRSTITLNEATPKVATVTTDELMKREIYSIAFEDKNSVRGIVSAEGIYTTEDGLNWKEMPQFGKQNYPVYIHPNGAWFVGSYKSSNSGKSYEPFIRWDQIAEAIESSLHRNPKLLRLTQISALPNQQIMIYVDTGSSKVKLRSSLLGSAWQVVRN